LHLRKRESTPPMGLATLTQESFLLAVSALAARDADLARVVATHGSPPFWTHAPGFPGLVIAILAQQVSLESAQAAFAKLEMAIGSINPEGFLSLQEGALKMIGFSRQKASYVRGIARTIVAGELDLEDLVSLDDEEARGRLMRVRGIGAWTADTYLLFALRRPDAWPSGDLALAKAVHEVRRLATSLRADEVDAIADDWRPWRAVAARILWHHYLSQRGRIASV
jgi:DNA-3-methyladenine glycosylase II